VRRLTRPAVRPDLVTTMRTLPPAPRGDVRSAGRIASTNSSPCARVRVPGIAMMSSPARLTETIAAVVPIPSAMPRFRACPTRAEPTPARPGAPNAGSRRCWAPGRSRGPPDAEEGERNEGDGVSTPRRVNGDERERQPGEPEGRQTAAAPPVRESAGERGEDRHADRGGGQDQSGELRLDVAHP
jgi:hypothetical protein